MKMAEGNKQNMSKRCNYAAPGRLPDAMRAEAPANPMGSVFQAGSPGVVGIGFMARLNRAPLVVSRNW